ncbi:unnamed protein product [Hymenolepis diminuta]|uniref:Uncharacterized protein n=1 Tax=Hymenolepis diminuta TaxID=6216 RepID=A0A564Z149_HYMDI|nr:unnamed protein product [Hymenolepis diminuta]
MVPICHVLTHPSIYPLFYNRFASPKKHICAQVLTHPYPSDSFKAPFFSHTITMHPGKLPASILTAHLLFLNILPSLSHSLQSSLWPP